MYQMFWIGGGCDEVEREDKSVKKTRLVENYLGVAINYSSISNDSPLYQNEQ